MTNNFQIQFILLFANKLFSLACPCKITHQTANPLPCSSVIQLVSFVVCLISVFGPFVSRSLTLFLFLSLSLARSLTLSLPLFFFSMPLFGSVPCSVRSLSLPLSSVLSLSLSHSPSLSHLGLSSLPPFKKAVAFGCAFYWLCFPLRRPAYSRASRRVYFCANASSRRGVRERERKKEKVTEERDRTVNDTLQCVHV